MKTAFITGANVGQANLLTKALAERGWRVFAGVLPGAPTDLKTGGNITVVEQDVSNTESVRNSAAVVKQALENVGSGKVRLDRTTRTVRFLQPGVELDPGGIGKGYAIDRLVAILKRRGVTSAFLSAGGSSLYGRRGLGIGSLLLRRSLLRLGLLVMIVIMAAVRTMNMRLQIAILRLDRCFQFLAADGTISDLSLFEEEIDDLVLIERRAKLRGGHRVLTDILDKTLAILWAVLLRGLHDQAIHFLLADDHAIGLADFRKKQAEADATHRDGAIVFLLRFHFLEGRFGIFLMARVMLKLGPDLVEFGLDHAGRHVEIMRSGQLVEQLALHIGTGQDVMFLLDLALQQLLELVQTFQSQRLGEIIVQLGFVSVQDRLDGDVEGRFLARE